MSSSAPSAGTKVSAGPNDRVIHEGSGAVQSDSLAAESQAFGEANAASQEGGESTSARAPGSSTTYTQGNMARETGNANVDSAPSYATNQYRDTSGPHGKNITEDNSIGTEDREKNASLAAIGSKNDPSLLAERKIQQDNAFAAGASGGGGRAVHEKTPYEVLGSEREA